MAQEPKLEAVPAGMLRRMSKAVRMGIAAGLPLLGTAVPDGIIMGTANGGMEDCIKFLNQIIDYEEGMLTPGNFVQSTPNAIAGQLSLIKKNRNYNATHVHLGLAFENALIDTQLFLLEQPELVFLTGAVDEISSYNYNIDRLAGWYNPGLSNTYLYTIPHDATIAGEGAAAFLLSGARSGSLAKIEIIETLHTTAASDVLTRMQALLDRYPLSDKTLLITGENGDQRYQFFYDQVETLTGATPVVRFKHLTGEYPTASSFALWLAGWLLQNQALPDHFFKRGSLPAQTEQVLIYNQYHGRQHSIICITRN